MSDPNENTTDDTTTAPDDVDLAQKTDEKGDPVENPSG